MACCLTAPSHYINQCWLITNGVLCHSPRTNFTEPAQDISSKNEFKNDTCKLLPQNLGANELMTAVTLGSISFIFIWKWMLLFPTELTSKEGTKYYYNHHCCQCFVFSCKEYSPFHEISASWRECSLLLAQTNILSKMAVMHQGGAYLGLSPESFPWHIGNHGSTIHSKELYHRG